MVTEYAVAIHTGKEWHVGHARSLQDALRDFRTCVSPRKQIMERDELSDRWTHAWDPQPWGMRYYDGDEQPRSDSPDFPEAPEWFDRENYADFTPRLGFRAG